MVLHIPYSMAAMHGAWRGGQTPQRSQNTVDMKMLPLCPRHMKGYLATECPACRWMGIALQSPVSCPAGNQRQRPV